MTAVVTSTDDTRELTKADFQSDAETRWCPGCGDYAILAAVQAFLPELGIPPERTVFMSGIGCAGDSASHMMVTTHQRFSSQKRWIPLIPRPAISFAPSKRVS